MSETHIVALHDQIPQQQSISFPLAHPFLRPRPHLSLSSEKRRKPPPEMIIYDHNKSIANLFFYYACDFVFFPREKRKKKIPFKMPSNPKKQIFSSFG
jgi:hypothetical protein|tara:strand:+ start:72 stop:365 length:294 start_codon:yes stop_codon:yes gene_type:complete